MSDKIRELQRQIEAENRRISNCRHSWGEAYNNPETTREPYGSVMITQGSDCWYEPQGYEDVTKPRWTRKCSECGKEEHTYKQKPVIESYKPDFN